MTNELLAEAVDANFSAVLLTVDLPRSGRRERDLRTGVRIPHHVPSIVRALGSAEGLRPEDAVGGVLAQDVSWRDVEAIAESSGLPVLVKGILTHEDALLACESGAAGVVVSNHGGRQLDGVEASIEALPEVVEAVAGRVPVLMDGGVRRGTDIVKALALGAQAVLAGPSVCVGPRSRRRERRLARPRASTRRAGARARAPRLHVARRGHARARQPSLKTSIVPE